MPSSHYRRRVRNMEEKRLIVPETDYYINVAETIIQKRICELENMYQYFYDIMDYVIKSFDVTEAISGLHSIIDNLSSKVDYYNLIQHIETNILSIVSNITDRVPLQIIKERIAYIKIFIDELPPVSCEDLGPVALMTSDLLDFMSSQTDYGNMKIDVTQIFNKVHITYPNMEIIPEIQDKLCGVIQNIIDGQAKHIIQMRIDYINSLIEQIRDTNNNTAYIV